MLKRFIVKSAFNKNTSNICSINNKVLSANYATLGEREFKKEVSDLRKKYKIYYTDLKEKRDEISRQEFNKHREAVLLYRKHKKEIALQNMQQHEIRMQILKEEYDRKRRERAQRAQNKEAIEKSKRIDRLRTLAKEATFFITPENIDRHIDNQLNPAKIVVPSPFGAGRIGINDEVAYDYLRYQQMGQKVERFSYFFDPLYPAAEAYADQERKYQYFMSDDPLGYNRALNFHTQDPEKVPKGGTEAGEETDDHLVAFTNPESEIFGENEDEEVSMDEEGEYEEGDEEYEVTSSRKELSERDFEEIAKQFEGQETEVVEQEENVLQDVEDDYSFTDEELRMFSNLVGESVEKYDIIDSVPAESILERINTKDILRSIDIGKIKDEGEDMLMDSRNYNEVYKQNNNEQALGAYEHMYEASDEELEVYPEEFEDEEFVEDVDPTLKVEPLNLDNLEQEALFIDLLTNDLKNNEERGEDDILFSKHDTEDILNMDPYDVDRSTVENYIEFPEKVELQSQVRKRETRLDRDRDENEENDGEDLIFIPNSLLEDDGTEEGELSGLEPKEVVERKLEQELPEYRDINNLANTTRTWETYGSMLDPNKKIVDNVFGADEAIINELNELFNGISVVGETQNIGESFSELQRIMRLSEEHIKEPYLTHIPRNMVAKLQKEDPTRLNSLVDEINRASGDEE